MVDAQMLHVSCCRLREYWDLDEAFDRHGCEAVLCVPILPELPNWAQPPARPGGPGLEGPLPVLPAFGVLTFGFDASTLVDARWPSAHLPPDSSSAQIMCCGCGIAGPTLVLHINHSKLLWNSSTVCLKLSPGRRPSGCTAVGCISMLGSKRSSLK